ncbi:MAG: hypothetical protein Fur0020_04020 [Thermodesulfovibrionia bacterium]
MKKMLQGLKQEIRRALQERDYKGIIELWSKNNGVIRMLISMTYDKADIMAWRAIEAIGLVTKAMSEKRPTVTSPAREDVRNLAGRLLWMMRDESGGIGWSAPEILGEIIRNNPGSCVDLIPVLLSFHEEEMLCSGVMWAMGRIAEIDKGLVLFAIPTIVSHLNDPNPYIRGMAIWSLNKMNPDGYRDMVKGVALDNSEIMIYDKGELQRTSIAELINTLR